jgi:hypothetical protein
MSRHSFGIIAVEKVLIENPILLVFLILAEMTSTKLRSYSVRRIYKFINELASYYFLSHPGTIQIS